MSEFAAALRRGTWAKHGERPSVLDFIPQSQHGAVRDGSATVDLTGWIQDGLDSLQTAGGGVLYLPWGVYPIVDIDIPSNVTLVGDGPAKTILKRRSNLPTGRGLLNLAGEKSGFESLAIDGQVTTPQVAIYSSLSDPSSAALTANSSVRIHPGAKDITLRRFRIFHSGGYAVHIDARTGDVYRVAIDEPHLHDNRSWLFGALAGSEIYGSWTGGILAQGDGLSNNHAVRGLKVTGGKFRRGTGNQVWSHVYGFGTLHSDFRIQGNSFEDIGRDGIMIGAVVGGDVSGNNFRRIGYVATDDTNPAVPRWINGQWAVGLDTAGLTRGVSYRGNSFVSCYGAAMDLDGFAEGVVSDNTVIVPAVGEPEYAEDAIASWAGNYCYGAQTSNTNNLADAAVGVRVTGNRFRNCGLGAVRMYASRRGSVSGNTIEHPAGATVAPIVLGNIGSGANQRAYANTVTDNDIHYSPAAITASVQEDPNGFAFSGSDINRVYGNRLHGTNTFEFLRAATSGSRTAREFASNKSGLAAESKTTLQREDGYLRAYWTNGSVTKSVLSLLDQAALSGGGSGGPLLNISLDAVGGVIATGARTSSAFDDAMLSSKVYADGFLAIAATTFSAADANLLADTVGLIRYNSTSKIFEQSTSVAAGARVWTPLSPQALSGLTAGRIPYTTSANAIADTANLAWNNTGRVLTVTGATGTASIVAATSFIQSQEGFLTTSAASTAINALSGGVSALSLISVRNDGAAGVNLVRNAGANQRSFGIGVNGSGQLFVSDQTAVATRITVNAAGLVTVGSTVSIDQAGNLSASATVAAAGVNVSGAAFNSLQVPAGGLYAGLGATLDQGLYLKTFAGAPNSPGAGYGALSHRSGSTYLYWDGSAWQTVNLAVAGGGVTSLTGTANQVNVSAATGAVTLSLPQNIHTGASPSFAGMTVSNNSGSTVGGVVGVVSVVDGSFAAASPRFMVRNTSSTSNGASLELNGSTARWAIGQDFNQNGGNNLFVFDRIAGDARFYVDSSGFVGIGTTLPRRKLDVFGGGICITDPGGASRSIHWGDSSTGIFPVAITGNATSGQCFLAFSTNTFGNSFSEQMRVTSSGSVLVATTTDDGSGSKLQVNSFVRAASGFATPSANTDAIQAPSGGVTARFLIGTRSLTLVGDTAANAGLSGSAQGRIYFDSGTNKFRVSENGGAFQDLTGVGVTSLTGTANQVNVSAATGAVTLSLPQNIHTGASPTFAGVTAGAFSATATGTAIAFQTSNFNFQVNGNGVVSSAAGFNAGGVNVIDASQNVYVSTLQTTGNVAAGSPDTSLARMFVRASDVNGLRIHNSGVPSPSGGAGVQAAIEAAPSSGDRLAFYAFGIRTGGAFYNGSAITAFATQAWTPGSAHGTELRFETTANGASARGVRMTIGNSGLVTIGSTLSIDQAGNLTATGVVQAGGINANAASPAYNSLQTNGGVYAMLGATVDQAVYLKTFAGTPNSPGGGYGALSHRSGSTYLYWNGSAWGTVDLAASGGGVTSLTGTANQVNVSAATGAVTLSLPQSIHTGASPTFGGLTVTGIIGVGSSPSTALGNLVVTGSNGFIEQPTNFRAVARFSGDANSGIILDTASVANSSGYRRGISWSYGTDDFRLARFATNGTSSRITDLYVHSNGNVLVATESDDASGAKLQINGFARAITGFATPATATDAIQASSGGVTARFLIGTRSLTLTADSAANAGLSGSAQGRIYFDSSTNKFRVSENGGAYVDLLSAAGVTSLTGTANQVNVSASTGAVTLSLPQNIHTGASPTFAGVTAGAFSATATGTAIGFQTTNFNFQVNGNGVVSSAGGINVAGATVIDSSRNATNLASATASGVFQSQASGTSIAFQTTNFNFQVNGNGVVSSAGGINVSGFNVINTARQFVGSGIDVGSGGISAGGYNVSGGFIGQTWNVVGSFTINGTPFTTLVFRGGILVSAS